MSNRFLITLISLILIILIAAGFLVFYRSQTITSCDQFKNGIVRDLPVRCLEYFNQK